MKGYVIFVCFPIISQFLLILKECACFIVPQPLPFRTRHTLFMALRADNGPLVDGETRQDSTKTKNTGMEADDFVQRDFEIIDENTLELENARLHPPSTRTAEISKAGKTATSKHHYESLPFSLIVGQDLVKQALLVAAVDTSLSIVLYGPKGTGKSVLARALYHLLPTTKEVTMVPKVHVPLHCQEDALLGTVDLERSLATGRAVLEPGLLYRAHKGLLIIDDVHLLEPELAHILWNAVDSNRNVTLEREGLSATYPCQPLTIATMNPDEGEVDDSMQCWLDRIAIRLPVNSSMPVKDRVSVVESMEGFLDSNKNDDKSFAEAVEKDTQLRASISEARRLLPFVQHLSLEQLEYLCKEATAADCEGQRGEIFAAKIAQASAALQQRIVVNAEDLQLGVLLAIAPRARRWVGPDGDANEETSQESSSPPPNKENAVQPQPPPEVPRDQESDNEIEKEDSSSVEEPADPEEGNEEEEVLIPDEFMFSPDYSTPLDPRLLQFQQEWTRRGKKGKGSRILNLKRGRFVKAVFPPPGMIHQGKIAVGATLRAAAPFQRHRREHAKESKLVYIRDDDIRLQRMKRKAGSLVLFVVDASGSMALNRMSAAKGAALTLLQEAYRSRDKIALIAFHGQQAQVLVPPTKSMAFARTRLDQMPCGGRSPLAHALVTALRTGLNAVKVKGDVGRAVVVLITDGRPTVPLCVSEGVAFDAVGKEPTDVKSDGQASRKFCEKEVFAIAKQIGAASTDLDVLVIDTEDKFVATGVAQEIARLSQGSYYALDGGSTVDIVATTRKHVH